MAGFAIDFGDVVGMRVFLDVGVAVVAFQAAMNARAELIAVNSDAVAGGVLHGLVAVTGEAFRLSNGPKRREA